MNQTNQHPLSRKRRSYSQEAVNGIRVSAFQCERVGEASVCQARLLLSSSPLKMCIIVKVVKM